jgi:hypothetical protein
MNNPIPRRRAPTAIVMTLLGSALLTGWRAAPHPYRNERAGGSGKRTVLSQCAALADQTARRRQPGSLGSPGAIRVSESIRRA